MFAISKAQLQAVQAPAIKANIGQSVMTVEQSVAALQEAWENRSSARSTGGSAIKKSQGLWYALSCP